MQQKESTWPEVEREHCSDIISTSKVYSIARYVTMKAEIVKMCIEDISRFTLIVYLQYSNLHLYNKTIKTYTFVFDYVLIWIKNISGNLTLNISNLTLASMAWKINEIKFYFAKNNCATSLSGTLKN